MNRENCLENVRKCRDVFWGVGFCLKNVLLCRNLQSKCGQFGKNDCLCRNYFQVCLVFENHDCQCRGVLLKVDFCLKRVAVCLKQSKNVGM